MKDYRKIFVSFLLAITLFFSFSDTIQSLLSQSEIFEIEISEEGELSEKDFDEIYNFSIPAFTTSNVFQIYVKLSTIVGRLNYQEPASTINTPPPELV